MKTRPSPATIALAGLLALPACAGAPVTGSAEDHHGLEPGWATDAVFYLAFVRSFADSTTGPLAGDGIGDFRGMIERLDYLNDGDPTTDTDLGVTALWLLPIAESPSYHGYDATDYTATEPDYGTMDDFRELLDTCHARGIRVVFDLVLNHCSSDHPWFLDSIDPDSDKRDWFVWRDERPEQRGPWGQPVWHTLNDRDIRPPEPLPPEAQDDSYYGVFWSGMPDLNYDTPKVTEAMHEAARFWLEDVGVDGFRLDAIKYLIERGDQLENTQDTIDWFKDFSAHVQSVKPGAWMVGEVWDSPEQIERYIGGDSPALDSCFDFPFAYAVMEGLRDTDTPRLRRDLERSFRLNGHRASTFLSNHDMDRSMPFMGNSVPRARAAAALLLTNPGTPFLYYGEELGMIGTGPHPRIRTPMQWTGDRDTVGFTTGTPWEAPQPNARTASVETQTDDPDSLLSWYRTLIRLRAQHPALRRGDFTLVTPENHPSTVVAYTRSIENGQRLLVIVNAGPRGVTDFRVDAAALGLDPEREHTDLITGQPVSRVLPNHPDKWRPVPTIRPYATHIIELD